jgi:transcriptional regulator with XRE-family HTH domain
MNTYAVDGLRTRRNRGAVTFAHFPVYKLALLRPKEVPAGYPCELVTIGDHIRKRRLDLGMTQPKVAEVIGVKECSIWNWEHGTEPEIRYLPAIIAFLRHVPFECPNDTLGRLRYFKRVNGLSYRRLRAVPDNQLSNILLFIGTPFGLK